MTEKIKAELEETIQGLFQKEDRLREFLQRLVQKLLEAEVENHVQARKYERSADRRGRRNGYKRRQLKTRVGVLQLQVPQVREGRFQSQLFGRYQRQEAALMTTIAEMYYQGVSTRRVAVVMEQLGGFEVSSTTVSRVAQDLDEQLEQFRSRRLDTFEIPYLMIDARYEKVRVEGHVVTQAVLVTAGINSQGLREILDWRVADSESEFTWDEVFQTLKLRGLRGFAHDCVGCTCRNSSRHREAISGSPMAALPSPFHTRIAEEGALEAVCRRCTGPENAVQNDRSCRIPSHRRKDC